MFQDLILAGNAYFTLESKITGTRFTYRVYEGKKAKSRGVSIHYVNLLYGRDNENDYTYIGYIKDGQFFHGGRNSRVNEDAPSVRGFGWYWQQVKRDNKAALEKVELWGSNRCCRCGRRLTVPSSVALSLGPECVRHVINCIG